MPTKTVAKPKGVPAKGKPLGIPMWGWIAAAAVGLIIGYVLLKRSSANAANSAPASSTTPSANGAGADSSGSGGGIAIPPGTTQDLISTMTDPGTTGSSGNNQQVYTGPGAAALAASQPGGTIGSSGWNPVTNTPTAPISTFGGLGNPVNAAGPGGTGQSPLQPGKGLVAG